MSPSGRHSALVDVTGVGINATDTVIQIPYFPKFNSKLQLRSAQVYAGGQVASALIACHRWGLSARYVGTVGDDSAASLQRREFRKAGVESHLVQIASCLSQTSFILVDRGSGERTILWQRDHQLALLPAHLRQEWIAHSKILLVDGHDAAAAAQAAQWARNHGIPVVADVDNIYPGIKALLKATDFLFASQDFPVRLMKNSNLLQALPAISRRFGCRVCGVTLGNLGALAWDGARYHYCRGFRISAVDCTGAGDIFHAGVVFGVLRRWPLDAILEFSCAAAALNCTAFGARGGIKSLARIRSFMRTARRSQPALSFDELRRHEAH